MKEKMIVTVRTRRLIPGFVFRIVLGSKSDTGSPLISSSAEINCSFSSGVSDISASAIFELENTLSKLGDGSN